MSVNEKMTALADEVRRLSGSEEKLGIEAMTEKLAGVKIYPKYPQIIQKTITELNPEDLVGDWQIRWGLFSDCVNLITVNLANSNVSYLANYAFQSCRSLKNLIFAEQTTDITAQAFRNCVSLEEVNLPSALKALGSAFEGCTGIKKVKFSSINSLTIGGYCFSGCTAMQYYDFTELSVVPILSATTAFNYIPDTAKIIVPASLYDEWIVASNWANFADHIVPDTIDGTWVFNDTISWERDVDCDVNFIFTAVPDTNHVNMKFYNESAELQYFLENGGLARPYTDGVWASDDFKIVSFGDTPQTCNAEFLAFMYHNATKQEG